MKKTVLILFINILSHLTIAQSFGFILPNEKEVVRIPFEIHNNFIVVQVVINKSLPLKFIFDTGAEHTILSKNIIAAALNLKYDRPIKIIGSDLNKEIVAYVSTKVHLKVGEAIAPSQDMLILKDDYFKIDEYVGQDIHGIIGADLFRNLVLKIDYRKNLITVRQTKNFKPPKGKWKEVPVTIEKYKPYIIANAHYNDKISKVKLLVDSGASLSLLLHTNTSEDLEFPESLIKGSVGRGLGGILEGFLGRLNRLEFGDFYFNNIVANYQDISETMKIESISKRNGILGGVLMSRFNIIIDYPKEKLYLWPHRKYNKNFKYDKSGLELILSGNKLKTIIVYNILKNSPAYEAGIRKGDQIISVNYAHFNLLNLRGVYRKLTRKSGKKIRIKVKRKDKILVFKFQLRDLL